MQLPVHKPLVVIVGPTAVGKTHIAIEVAKRLQGEIISADSRLFYRGMDVGTAKPTEQERRQVSHHLVDIADPDETWSLSLFQQEAHRCIEAIHKKRKLPLLVGGTGQYVHAVIEGWTVPRLKPNDSLRKTLNEMAAEIGSGELHHKLALIDPVAAAQIDACNVRRTIRALEVILSTGKLFSLQRSKNLLNYDLKIIGLNLPREELYHRIDERIKNMFEQGFVEEVKGLISGGFSPDLPSMSAIGYHEVAEYLQGKITLEDAMVKMKRRTRQFVRRQSNWFKLSDPTIHWFLVTENIVNEIVEFIQSAEGWINPSKSEG